MSDSISLRMRNVRAFTITELLVVVAIIVLLLALLLPALGGVMASGEVTTSMNNMRQISTWMAQYAQNNDDYIVPSRFNYRDNPYPGKVRSNPNPVIGMQGSGTWADILHAENAVELYPDAAPLPAAGGLGNDFRYDAPDRDLYDLLGAEAVRSPFRSTAPNSRNWNDRQGGEPAKPYGKGAQEEGDPGYFAANDFFRSGWVTGSGDDDRVVTNGRIRAPSQSLYLIDSYLGEVIDDTARAYEPNDRTGDGDPDWDIDFRYAGETALILFLDGHVENVSQWLDLEDLARRKIRVCGLDQRQCTLE